MKDKLTTTVSYFISKFQIGEIEEPDSNSGRRVDRLCGAAANLAHLSAASILKLLIVLMIMVEKKGLKKWL